MGCHVLGALAPGKADSCRHKLSATNLTTFFGSSVQARTARGRGTAGHWIRRRKPRAELPPIHQDAWQPGTPAAVTAAG